MFHPLYMTMLHWPLVLFDNHNYVDVNIMQSDPTVISHHRRLELYSFRSPLTNLIITLVPFSGSLCTSILPSWDSIISFVMESPRPAPPLCLERDFSTRYNRSKIYGRSCS